MTVSTFKIDFDVDPGPTDVTYSPSMDMLATIRAIAGLEDLSFRFWAAMTLFVNMSSVFPCSHAEEVGAFVVDDAIEEGEPTDGHYQLILDAAGDIKGVGYEDEAPEEPGDYDRLIFEIAREQDVAARQARLVQLVTLCAITEENRALDERLAQCRSWNAANAKASSVQH